MNRQEVINHITPIIKESKYKISKTYTKSKYLMQFHIISDEKEVSIGTIKKINKKISNCRFFDKYVASFSIIGDELVLQLMKR